MEDKWYNIQILGAGYNIQKGECDITEKYHIQNGKICKNNG